MSPEEYGLDGYQRAILAGFYLSLENTSSLEGVSYKNDYAIIKDFANQHGFNPLELLDICSGLRDALRG